MAIGELADQDEVGIRVHGAQAMSPQPFDECIAFGAQQRDLTEELVAEVERSTRDRLGDARQVVGQAHEAQGVDHLGSRNGVAHASPGERESLAHGASDDEVGVSLEKRERRRRAGSTEFGVRLVDDHDSGRHRAGGRDDVKGERRAGGIVGRGEDEDVG